MGVNEYIHTVRVLTVSWSSTAHVVSRYSTYLLIPEYGVIGVQFHPQHSSRDRADVVHMDGEGEASPRNS